MVHLVETFRDMQSAIYAKDVASDAQVPAAPTDAVRFSSGTIWQGLQVEYHTLAPQQMPMHTMQNHRLLVNIGKPVNFEWSEGGMWKHKWLAQGAMAMKASGESHSPRWNDELRIVAIALETTWVERLVERQQLQFDLQPGQSDEILLQLSKKFFNEIQHGNLGGKMYGESLGVAFALQLLTTYGQNNQVFYAPKGKLSAEQLRHALDYVHDLLHQNIGLNEIAEQVYLSPFHFARLFKNTLGVSPHQYLLSIRIEKAKQLIATSSRSLTDVAGEVGYFDQSHFIHSFKRMTGLSPKQFKRMVRS